MFSNLKTLLIEDYRAFMRPRASWSPPSSRRSLVVRRWNILVRDWMFHPRRTFREGVLELQGISQMLPIEDREDDSLLWRNRNAFTAFLWKNCRFGWFYHYS